MRVHSGQRLICWEDHEWQGIGDVLRQNASSNQSILSPRTSRRGRISASLPISREMQEVLAEEYYRDRIMEWIICTVDEKGEVERRVFLSRGRIDSYRRSDDSVTFTAECEVLDSLREYDIRHKRRVFSIRRRFKSSLSDMSISSGTGWLVSLVEMFADAFGFVIDAMEVIIPGRNRRIVMQRWSARRRTYWFRTEPQIPGIRRRRNGYRVRAVTLDEAKEKLYEMITKRIWNISPNFINMIIYWNDRPLEFLNLDVLRQRDDPRRYEATSLVRRWPP